MKRVFVPLLGEDPASWVAWAQSCAPAEGQIPIMGSHKEPALGMMRKGPLLLAVSFLMCVPSYAQEESEGYDPFGECSNYYSGAGAATGRH